MTKNANKGWHSESARHSLARKGIKTGQKTTPKATPKKTMNDIKSDLSHFTGTEQYHQGWAGVKWTDGIAHFAQKHAGWLITDISSYWVEADVRKEPFQVWTLTVNKDKTATLKMTDGNSEKAIKTQKYTYTELPEGELKFYLADGVLLLPSEY